MKSRFVIIGILCFFAAGLAFAYEAPPTVEECGGVTSLGIARMPGIIDAEKVTTLLQTDYRCAKHLLGLWGYEFYLEMTNFDGSYVSIDNNAVIYGLYPGKSRTDETQLVSGTNLLRSTDVLYSWKHTRTIISFPSLRPPSNTIIITDGGLIDSTYIGSVDLIERDRDRITFPERIIPDYIHTRTSLSFDRFVILDVNGQLQLVRLTLGVWN